MLRSVGCHWPLVSPDTWPLVFFMSRMYMSPRMNSPRVRPSRSMILACVVHGCAQAW